MSRAPAAVVALGLLAYSVLASAYALRTPIWQNPDEPAHYNYVVHVAETASLPELQHGDWDSQLLERLKNGRLLPGDDVASIRYESWQPPLAYVLAAPVALLTPAVEPRVVLLRMLSVTLGGLTLLVAYRVGLAVLPPGLAAAVPITMSGVPMFTAVSASISADPLANLLAALILLTLVRRLLGKGKSWWPVGAGALLGLGLLTKLALAIFVPLALVVVLLRAGNQPRAAALLLGAMLLVMSPWLVHQVAIYGWTDPLAMTRHAQVVADQPRLTHITPEYAWQFLTVTFHSFWAQFGWMAAPASDSLYWIWGVLVSVAILGLVRGRAWLAQRAALLLVGVVAAACAALVAYNLTFTQFQGRYLFTALVPLAILFVAGWSSWLPDRLRVAGALCGAWALVALNAYTFWRVLLPAFAPVG